MHAICNFQRRLGGGSADSRACPGIGPCRGCSGRKEKAQACAVCHGLDGVARQPDAANISGETPIYLTRQLEAFRSGERKHEQMSIIAQGLSDADIADLAAWYSSLKISVEMPE